VASALAEVPKVDATRATFTRSFINSLVTAQLAEEGVKAGDIGDRIVEDFFDGDYKKALSRNGHKVFSLRAVVAEIGRDGLCKLGRSALTQNVQIAAQRNMLGWDAVAGLDRGQQFALVSLKSQDEKLRWIEIARKDDLGANKLKADIRASQKPKRPRKGKAGARQTPMSVLVVRALQVLNNQPSPKAFDAFWEAVDFAKEDPAEVGAFQKWSTGMIASLKQAKAKAKQVTASKAR